MIPVIIGIVAAVLGAVAGGAAMSVMAKKGRQGEADLIIKEAEVKAESIRQSKMEQAKQKFEELKAQHQREVAQREEKLIGAEQRARDGEQRIRQKEQSLNQRFEEAKRERSDVERDRQNLEREKERLKAQTDLYAKKVEEVERDRARQIEQLERIAGLSAEEAKAQLVENIKAEASTRAMAQAQEMIAEAKLTAEKEAKRIVVQTIQRTATEHTVENAVSVFNIESDEVKGRIIGREGRNIRALEAATGIEIIVDDTPEAIILSGFDPIRRETARLALHQLVTDGRIHPARIEEVVAKTKRKLEEEIVEIGKRTAIDLGIHGLHPELIRMVGRMRYRSSYGQNLLQHSREVANMCAIMAAELGLDVKLARRAGLLHDIGKVPDEEPELPHAIYGMRLAEKFGEHPEVCNAIGAHHDEIEMTSMLSPIIQVCDAISGARPGARREVVASYIKRLNDLEALALSFPGVTKTYAIQAGRELRVIVDSDRTTDAQSDQMANEISARIMNEMTYPGQVRVTVIREKRAVAIAK